MKVGIIGGGISGLSTAYYLKKFRLPVSQITIFEASNRLGGWVNSKRIEFGGDTFYFEKGPRTLRLSTLEPKEINSIELAKDLNLESSIQLVSKDHPASRNRFIYFNNKINAIQPKLFGKSELLGKSILAHLFKEFRTKPRDPSVEDESLWSFIERRFDSTIADNLVDPVFKGICGGDVKKLSSAAFVENIYNNELKYGSITKGVMKGKSSLDNKPNYPDLLELRKSYTGQSVWRLKNGTEEMITKLADHLSSSEGVKIHLNEPLIDLDVDQSKTERSIKIKSKSIEDDFDIVISAINSKLNNQFLPEKYQKLKELLNKIDTVNMVVVNMYFKKDILPVKGFGYLVPTNQKSAILGCIFDSVLDEVHKDHTVLTVMMGGAWFDEYIGSKSNDEIYTLALNELKKHLNIQIDPDIHEVNVLKDSIPQYRVGHLNLLKQIDSSLQELKLDKKLYLTGWSYNGIGVNDCIFNGRKLVQEKLMKTNN